MAVENFLIFFLDNADMYGMLVEKKGTLIMVGSVVDCVIRSASGNHLVSGEIVRQCDNPNVYVMRLSNMVDFVDSKKYTYPAGSTILVAKSEIMR